MASACGYDLVKPVLKCWIGVLCRYMDALVDTLEEMASITTLDVSNNRLSWVSASKLGTLLKKRTRDLGGQKLQIENLQVRTSAHHDVMNAAKIRVSLVC